MAPQAGQQPSARDRIPLLICKNFVELRGFEPLTPSMPWRCATSCATAPRGPGTDEPGPKGRTSENRTSTVERSYPSRRRLRPDSATGRQPSSGWRGWPVSAACRRRCGPGTRRAVDVVRPGFGLGHDGLPALLRLQRRHYGNGAARAVYGDDEPGPFGPNRLGGIMSDTPLAGRVAMVSGGGRGSPLVLPGAARQGAKVVVNNRNGSRTRTGAGLPTTWPRNLVAAGGEGGGRALRRGRPGRRGSESSRRRWRRRDSCMAIWPGPRAATRAATAAPVAPAGAGGDRADEGLHGVARPTCPHRQRRC